MVEQLRQPPVKDDYSKMKERKKYTVWIGDIEMTDSFVAYQHAKMLHSVYESRGYKDVVIREGRTNEELD